MVGFSSFGVAIGSQIPSSSFSSVASVAIMRQNQDTSKITSILGSCSGSFLRASGVGMSKAYLQ